MDGGVEGEELWVGSPFWCGELGFDVSFLFFKTRYFLFGGCYGFLCLFDELVALLELGIGER